MNELKSGAGHSTLSAGTLLEKGNCEMTGNQATKPHLFGFGQALIAMREGAVITRIYHGGHMRILKNTTVQHVEQNGTVHAFQIPELLVINRTDRPGGYDLVTLDNADLMAQDYMIVHGR